MEDRRRVARQSAAWMGSCHIECEAPRLWRECRVFDISTLGIGLELAHPRPSGLVGRRISVRLPAAGESVDVMLHGEIRNASTDEDGTVRAGVEFAGLSEDEMYIVDLVGRPSFSTTGA